MSAVQVNDAKGNSLTKILSGETAAQAKERISLEGILENSDGLALPAGDRITPEGAPYVFKPLQQQLLLQQQQDDTMSGEAMPPQFKKQKSKQPFDMENLLPPLEVPPPERKQTPLFTCNADWMPEVETEIFAQLESVDSPCGEERVPPMAVVRCSRGGKTRALNEIANLVYSTSRKPGSDKPVVVIFVSFNDFSSLLPHEHDPLQALCQRIAFAARKREPHDSRSEGEIFQEFMAKDYDIGKDHIMQWLDGFDIPAVLIVDELNNLSELTAPKSIPALEFGHFIKTYFLGAGGRYFVFSSHVIMTLSFFCEYVDRSYGSARIVTVQELPLVDNLSTAMENLYKRLDGAREAIYFGLLPGLLFEESEGRSVQGKRVEALGRFKDACKGMEEDYFKEVLRSLFTGDASQLQHLQILFDGCGEAGSLKARWVPCHLQYVLENMFSIGVDGELRKLGSNLAKFCKGLKDSDETSGKGWEGLFVLFLVARSINGCSDDDYFLPADWFVSRSKVKLLFNPYSNPAKAFSGCRNWDELKRGIDASEDPTVSIFYPSHAGFEVYDAIIVYSVGKQFQAIYGYQLKEGKASPKPRPATEFTKSFVVKGDPPKKSIDSNGWNIASGDAIDTFFGESGKYWTPQHWKRLTDTLQSTRT